MQANTQKKLNNTFYSLYVAWHQMIQGTGTGPRPNAGGSLS